MTRILVSEIDKSKNIIIPHSAGGYFESRYVQRKDENFIVYLSSHNGCNYSCRMCHLTQTGQADMIPAEMNMYLKQAKEVLELYEPDNKIKTVHFNFMARGEPLANHIVLNKSQELFARLGELDKACDIHSKFKVSSIIPKDFKGALPLIFEDPRSELYYSLYSVSEKFRKKWLPKAMNPYQALDLIKDMQEKNGRQITLHWSLIDGENTFDEDISRTMEAVLERDIDFKFNLVRYNSHSSKTGVEPSEERVREIFETILMHSFNEKSKIVSRVGRDVHASCGTFYAGED